MYYANNKNGARINATSAKPGGIYTCPACGCPLILKRGSIVNTLTAFGDDGVQCMEIMAKAADATDHGLIKLSLEWQAEPMLCEVWDADFDDFLEKQNAKIEYESQERPVDCHERYLLAHGRSCVQVRTYEALGKLTRRAENVLEFFTKIAASDTAVRECFVRIASFR